jgi:hypothetical protein
VENSSNQHRIKDLGKEEPEIPKTGKKNTQYSCE